MPAHDSHDLRRVSGSSFKDFRCVKCERGAGGWGELPHPCPSADVYPLYYNPESADVYPEGMNSADDKAKAKDDWGSVLIDRIMKGEERRTPETLTLILWPYDEKKRIFFHVAFANALAAYTSETLFGTKACTPEELADKLYPDNPAKRAFIIRMYRSYGNPAHATTQNPQEESSPKDGGTEAP